MPALEAERQEPVARTMTSRSRRANAHRPIRTSAPRRTDGGDGLGPRLETDVDRRRRSGWRPPPERLRRARRATMTVAPRWRSAYVTWRVSALSPPNCPTTMRQCRRAVGTTPQPLRRSRTAATPGPEPLCRPSTSRARTVSGPQTPSAAIPQLRLEVLQRARRARARGSRRLGRSRSRAGRARDCSSATSSPRRFGDVRNSSRSPSLQTASTRAVQVCLVAATVGHAGRGRSGSRATARSVARRTPPPRRRGGWEPGGTEAALQVADGLAALTGCQREVGRNSLSSCSS